MDFTLKKYRSLLNLLLKHGYKFQTLKENLLNPEYNLCILRHDIDRIPKNALKIALLEKEFGIQSTYFFRIVDHVFKPNIIRQIANLGHKIGYHYEDLTFENGNIDKAYDSFCRNLEKFRETTSVNIICMHGSPLSKWDNRDIWKKYDYKKLGIIAEPYFDINYTEFFYITDTGRQWNNENISVRDKVDSGFNIKIKSTQHLFELIKSEKLPNKIMINTHPHRWFNLGFGWTKELILQNVKNVVKSVIVRNLKKNA